MTKPAPISDVSIGGTSIRLGQFLKFAGLFDSGGEVKEAIADGLVHALSGSSQVAAAVARGRERASGFTWDASAAAHAAVWRSVLAGD